MNIKAAKKILNETLGDSSNKGTELLFACPSCDHRKRKFSVNIAKNVFKCWICDYRGRSIRRVVRRFGGYNQLAAWDAIFGRQDIERFADLFMEGVVEERREKVELPPEFTTLCSEHQPATANYALRYLYKRGVSKADILKWKIGYCFGGEYRSRIIIPSFVDDGDCSYFIARSYNGDSYKYKNPPVSKDIVFNELFINWNEDLIIVEGVFDALVAGNAVPILGSTLRSNSDLIRKIVINDTPIYIALDPDARKKENRIIQMLLKYDIEMYKIDVTGYEDVGSMPKEIFRERKNNASFIDRDDYLLLNLLSAV